MTMASLGLDEEELKNVEQTLARLAQLSSSINQLRMNIHNANPLPEPKTMYSSAKIIEHHLQNLLDSIRDNHEIFAKVAVHPSTNFPGRTEEGIMLQLLRKKLEPDVEEQVEQGRAAAALVTKEGMEILKTLWGANRKWTLERLRDFVQDELGDVYTNEERELGLEKVRTGLKRDLEEEEGALMPGQQKTEEKLRGPEPETLLWFESRGDFDVPQGVDYGRKVGGYRGLQGVSVPQGHLS